MSGWAAKRGLVEWSEIGCQEAGAARHKNRDGAGVAQRLIGGSEPAFVRLLDFRATYLQVLLVLLLLLGQTTVKRH